ncbi:MAG: hypothetical protein RIC30_09385 [Marinoscillum sp.]|uniref:hypothetical protein n=1 Tax=Marinoscillum sp. TaxID=2024838 RepID=UPI0032F9FB6B
MSDNKFKLLDWAKRNAPKALDIVGDITGIKALNRLSDVIDKENPDQLSPEALGMARELKALDLEELSMRLADVANARNREIEIAKSGKSDAMMYVAGSVALGTFLLMVISIIFVEGTAANPMVHQLMGIIEGVALTIFQYYFGSSKGSSDKTKILTNQKP